MSNSRSSRGVSPGALQHLAQTRMAGQAVEDPDVGNALVELDEQAHDDLLGKFLTALAHLQEKAVEQRGNEQLQAFAQHDIRLDEHEIGARGLDEAAIGALILSNQHPQVRLDAPRARHQGEVDRVTFGAGDDADGPIDTGDTKTIF